MLKDAKQSNFIVGFEDDVKKESFDLIVGVDEAGRGPLAGPVVAAAALIHKKDFQSKIDDSKKVSEKQRDKAFVEICENAFIGIGIIDAPVIDRVNILNATFLAMNNAVQQLLINLPQEYKDSDKDLKDRVCLLIDGSIFRSELPYKYKTVVKGDSKVFSIACASIIAKVTRDRILHTYDQIFPQYGFKRHKGYPTKAHKECLREFGPCIIHRRSFKY